MTKYIYEPKGRAKEYCELALNLYRGCSHGCTYCYAPKMLHMSPKIFHEEPEPRLAVLANLEREAAAFKGREVFLCFSTDPYQPIDDEHQLTRQAIKVLHAAGCKVRILTKGGHRSERDFDLLAARPELSFYGATLTFTEHLNPNHKGVYSPEADDFEPYAACPGERFEALYRAHNLGIPTWASLEPVIDPEQTLSIIQGTHKYVDMYKIGRWNYDKRANEIDWKKFAREADTLLKGLGKQYYIKKDLEVYL